MQPCSDVLERILDEAAELVRHYFRISVEGLEHVPVSGAALIVPNHSGFGAADALMIAHLVRREKGRVPRILAHRAFFELFEPLRRASVAFGLDRVSVARGVELLTDEQLLLLFPEGESGNFKPSTRRYHLQPFHTGFVRMALLSGAPIVPCVVIGAEEAQLNLGSVDASRLLEGLRLPVPLNLFPLPSKWRIRFLEPIRLDHYPPGSASDRALTHELSVEIQIAMQRAINGELGQRKSVYF
ncbi:MAG: 1-acyl-sn-glycerol-3-phosphate acyltransferase [Deltaproteobacteria bacterium]|nr:1-acyl-sn-glycerol-3-phosphate acyltransferase [Deltaproteobacteria bacterium]